LAARYEQAETNLLSLATSRGDDRRDLRQWEHDILNWGDDQILPCQQYRAQL
jgi:hypothetical protein